ncbi:hypothetical protein ACHWQZ_G005456 [Mnemiopsis leidyi]
MFSVPLIRPNDKLIAIGAKQNKVKFVLFIILCVLTLSLTFILRFLLGFWKPKWKTLITHSVCAANEATVFLVEERTKCAQAKVVKVRLQKADLGNYIVNKLSQFSDHNDDISIVEYKLDRYVFTGTSLVRITGLGDGETTAVLKDMISSDNLALDTLTQVFGRNILDVPLKPVLHFVLTEVLTFFYFFQLFSCIVWYNNYYEIYATVIIVMSVLSAASTTYITRKAIVKLRRAVLFECEVEVKRGGKIETIKSGDLVPGDIVRVPFAETKVSYDGVLLCGSVVVDEAMLTGESVPTLKNPLPFEWIEEEYHADKNEVNTLFSGTTILQTRPPPSGEDTNVYCLVTRTGFRTKKGETVKFMLHPSQTQKFKFYSEAWTYIKIMAVIGLAGMIYNIYDCIKNEYSVADAILNSLDLITIIIAPSLPLALSIAVYYAIRRLKQNKIKVALPNSINIAGKVKMCVFDKTGTLTEEGLTLHCVLSVNSGVFSEEQTVNIDQHLRGALSCCHSLSVINDKICGDPIDLIGQHASGFEFKVSDIEQELYKNQVTAETVDSKTGAKLGLIKIIPFESHLKRMSVVCEAADGEVRVFCKGAPEQIMLHCDKATIPGDFTTQLDNLSSQGYRIIAYASKTLPNNNDILSTPRDSLESGLTFQGFLVLANRLKPETRVVVEELKRAGLRTVMCTGDNLKTAVCVGRDCSMIPDSADLYLVTAELREDGGLDVQYTLQEHTPVGIAMEDTHNMYWGPYRKVHLAMEGSTFQLISKHDKSLMDRVCVTGTIFARFSPEQKKSLIDEMQQRSYSICMCGDGANDCEALRHANVGIALSKCEASLAAPFTSAVFNITCVPVLLKEGRGALENGMAVFRFTAMYSVIQYVSVLLLIQYESILGDYQYLLEDLAVVLMFDFALGYTKPAKILAMKRPRGSLMHPYTIFSFIVQTVIVVGFLLLSMWLVQQQPWYDPFNVIRTAYLAEGEMYVAYYETTVNFVHSSFQYIIISLVVSIGYPHRRALYTNIPMCISVLLTTGILLLVMFVPPDKIPKLEMADIPSNTYKLIMLGLVVGNLVLALGVEYSYRVCPPLQWFLKFLRCKKGHKNKFKRLVDEMDGGGTWPLESSSGV